MTAGKVVIVRGQKIRIIETDKHIERVDLGLTKGTKNLASSAPACNDKQ